MINLKDFLTTKLAIKVTNFNLYLDALTHKSFANEHHDQGNYQRLEFLGDAIIYQIVTSYIYQRFPAMNEGQMSIVRANFVKGSYLTTLATNIELDRYLRIGKSQDLHHNDKILEDVFEALVGAIWLDGGSDAAEQFLRQFLLPDIDAIKSETPFKNPKTILQEYLQSESRETIEYRVQKTGHHFIARVYHDGNLFGEGKGKKIKEAEVNAAINALERGNWN